jgi:thiamine biosynthesis lipoprotein
MKATGSDWRADYFTSSNCNIYSCLFTPACNFRKPLRPPGPASSGGTRPPKSAGVNLLLLEDNWELPILSKMSAMKFACLLIAILLLAPGRGESSTITSPGEPYEFHYENVLGTSLEIKVVAASSTQSEAAEQTVLAEIEREAHILSSWDPQSEFSNWFGTSGQPVRISPELFEVLGLFDQWRELTHGALDASAETITRAWKRAAAEKRMPTPDELSAAVAGVQKVHWRLDPANRTATHTSDTPLAMNSFVKSYIAGRAADKALTTSGAQGLVVNIGGDIVVRGNWRELVDISDPRSDAENGAPIAHLAIRDRAVATSGDYRRGVEISGRHYSHIVDPRTGMPADQIISSTVVARTAAEAGALATALSVLTPEESSRLAASLPGVEYLLVRKNGERIVSSGWSSYEAAPVQHVAALRPQATFEKVAAQSKITQWDQKCELAITIELNLIEGYRVHRPYVAVWIEDENHAPVRTVALWFAKYKYLHELRAWSRDESLRSVSEDTHVMNSVSSATRPPGKYTFRWDGKDDSGNLVKPGKYSVMIEAAREHGTYQLMHQEMDFNGLPNKLQLTGDVEIASATLDYHKIEK